MAVLEFLLFATTVILLYIWTKRPKNFPPGPTSLPLIGNLPALITTTGHTPHDKLWNLCKKYGPVTGLFFGPKPVVVVAGYKAVKHVLGRDDLAYRPQSISITAHFFQRKLGVFFTDGPEWREQRRFTLRNLRDFGFGRRTMEALIHDETRALLETLGEASGKPQFDLCSLLPVHAINILWTIMAGTRYDVNDYHFMELTRAVMDFFRNGNPINLANRYPKLQKLPFIRASFDKQISAIRKIQDFLEETIAEHLTSYDENHMRDFIDVYIREMRIKSDVQSTFSSSQLCMICIDLFTAGTETTASTIAYCIRYLIHYPEVQAKLRAELLREVGSQRLPTMEDMNTLHYTQAVLNEVHRHSGLVPFTPPHSTINNVEILGYKVPKNTDIMVNLWSVHMDPEVWGDPQNFRPERFINEDGTLCKNEHMMIFGFGPRMCLGEPLARYSTLLIFAALVQHFEFKAPSMGPPPSKEQMQGFTTSPAPYLLSVHRLE